ncbi:MAG: hypothetical protein L6Q71_09515, partial [Planctomycetes bacterium]|nr:hypothetical protein [Planctomycetota bacterium]
TVARLNDAVERLEKSAVVETPSSPDEAKIRERATELADKVKQAIDAGDKPAVMKNMAELLKLGTVSYREFFDAYDTLLSKSNPYTTMNPLGLSQFEFFGLLPREFAELALRNPNNDIPVGSRCAALYIAPYTGVSDDAITDTYVAILANPNSHKWLLDAAIENARMAGNPKLVPALVQLTTNPLAPSNSRVKALATLILNSLPLVDTSELSPLAGDSDENVKRMYGIFLLAKTPPVNGFLIVECGLSSTNAGLLAGDIITRVAEAPATNLSSIDAAIAQLWLTSDFKATPTMTVEFYRDGEIKIISPPAPENIGVFDGYLQGIAVVNK